MILKVVKQDNFSEIYDIVFDCNGAKEVHNYLLTMIKEVHNYLLTMIKYPKTDNLLLIFYCFKFLYIFNTFTKLGMQVHKT